MIKLLFLRTTQSKYFQESNSWSWNTLSSFPRVCNWCGTSISQLGSDGYGIVVEVNGAIRRSTLDKHRKRRCWLYPRQLDTSFAGVALTSITGDGNAGATIGVVNGGITTVTVTKGGTNYSVGDVLGIGHYRSWTW